MKRIINCRLRKFLFLLFVFFQIVLFLECKDSNEHGEGAEGKNVYKLKLAGDYVKVNSSPLRSTSSNDILFVSIKSMNEEPYLNGVFRINDEISIELEEGCEYKISAWLYEEGANCLSHELVSRWYPYSLDEEMAECHSKYSLDTYYGSATTADAKSGCIILNLYRKTYELVFSCSNFENSDSLQIKICKSGNNDIMAQKSLSRDKNIEKQLLHLEDVVGESITEEIDLNFEVYYLSGNVESFQRTLIVKRNTQYNITIEIPEFPSYDIDVQIKKEEMDIEDITYDLKKSYYCQYLADGTKLLNGKNSSKIYINRHLDKTNDVGISFGNKIGTPNKNFDLCEVYLLERPSSGISKSCKSMDAGYQWLIGHLTDNIQPIRFNVEENADGDFAESSICYFTSGFHGYKNGTSPSVSATMKEISKEVYADGKELKEGDAVYCDNVKIVVENQIQASNTMKSNGRGREAMYQKIVVDVKGEYANIQIDFIPMEDVRIYQIGGLAFYNDLDSVKFISSDKVMGPYSKDQFVRVDKTVKSVCQYNSSYEFEMYVDPTYGLGNLDYNVRLYNASIESVPKSYFHLLSATGESPYFFPKGTRISFKGYYRFHKRGVEN